MTEKRLDGARYDSSHDQFIAELAEIGPDPNRPAGIIGAHAAFRKWLGEEYDLDALTAVLAAAAVEQLDGDPVWLLVVSGSGNAKT